MFADLTQPSGENLGDQPDVEPGAQPWGWERHAIPYHFDDMLWFTVYSLLEYMIQFDYIVLFFWMNLWLTDGFLANSLA